MSWLPDLPATAVTYARQGWEVLPCSRGPSKAPLLPHGHLQASNDVATVRAWWSRWPRANVAIRPPEGILILDLDPWKGGLADLARLERTYGPLPATMVSYSGRRDGGRHCWYIHPGGRVTGARLGRGLDLKSRTGYVLAPPSIHPSTGLPYLWGPPAPPCELPERWVALLRPSHSVPPRGGMVIRSGDALVASYPRRAAEHGRNNALWWSLTRALTDGDHQAIVALQHAARALGLTDQQIAKQLRGAQRAAGR